MSPRSAEVRVRCGMEVGQKAWDRSGRQLVAGQVFATDLADEDHHIAQVAILHHISYSEQCVIVTNMADEDRHIAQVTY